jgi:hypothetical protein
VAWAEVARTKQLSKLRYLVLASARRLDADQQAGLRASILITIAPKIKSGVQICFARAFDLVGLCSGFRMPAA